MILPSQKPGSHPNILVHILGGAVFLLISFLLYWADLPVYNVWTTLSSFLLIHLAIAWLLSKVAFLKSDFFVGYFMVIPSLILFVSLLLIEITIHPPSEE